MLSRTAAWGRNVAMWSSWKLDTSSTTTVSASRSSTKSENGTPMLPATTWLRPATSRTCPMSVVVVVLPFEPVTATMGPGQNQDATSISA